jgi:hypothetical protein
VKLYPDDWNLRLRLGYVYVSLLHDYEKGSQQFAAAAHLPSAPPYVGALAARLLAADGRLDAAIDITQELLTEVTNEKARESLQLRLLQLVAERDVEKLDVLLEQFATQTGHKASSFGELVAAGLIPQVPRDPWGDGYVLDAASGRASSKHSSGPLKVFEE